MKLPCGTTIGDKQIIIKRGSSAHGHLLDVYSNYFNSIILDKDIVASIKKTTDKSDDLISIFSLVDGLVMTRDFLIANGVAISDEKLKILSDAILILKAHCPKAFKMIEELNNRNRK
jgi:hypothetical protein